MKKISHKSASFFSQFTLKKVMTIIVSIFLVAGIGGFAFSQLSYKNEQAKKTTPPTIENYMKTGVAGSFVELTQNALQFELADNNAFSANKSALSSKFNGKIGTIHPGINYMFADSPISIADIIKGIDPGSNRLIIAYYTPGEGNLQEGFYTYPKGPFEGTYEIKKADIDTFMIPQNRGVVIISEKQSVSYGLLDGGKKPTTAWSNSPVASGIAGWVLVASKEPVVKNMISTFANRVEYAYALNSQNLFDKIDPAYFTLSDSGMVWLRLSAASTSGSTATSTAAPKSISFVEPLANASFLLKNLQTFGMNFKALDSNDSSKSYLRDTKGLRYMNYYWEIKDSTGATQWASTWTDKTKFPSLHSGDINCAVSVTDEAQDNATVDIWSCPSGIVPPAAFNAITAGNYTFVGYSGDGKIGSDPVSVAFTVTGVGRSVDGAATAVSKPPLPSFSKPAAGESLTVDSVKKGLAFALTSPRTAATLSKANTYNQDDLGTFYMNYAWRLTTGDATQVDANDALWYSNWSGPFPDGPASCKKTIAGVVVWVCSYGTIPASVVADIPTGTPVTLSAQVGNGKDSSEWKTVTFTVGDALGAATANPTVQHQKLIGDLQKNVQWSCNQASQNQKNGDMNYKCVISLKSAFDVPKTDNHTVKFDYVYKNYYEKGADDFTVSSAQNLVVNSGLVASSTGGGVFPLYPTSNGKLATTSVVSGGNVKSNSDGTVSVNFTVPWPGVPHVNDWKEDKTWGKTDIDMYFYDTITGSSIQLDQGAKQNVDTFDYAANQTVTSHSMMTYETQYFKMPKFKISVSANCKGAGVTEDVDDGYITVANIGDGFMPTNFYDAIAFYNQHESEVTWLRERVAYTGPFDDLYNVKTLYLGDSGPYTFLNFPFNGAPTKYVLSVPHASANFCENESQLGNVYLVYHKQSGSGKPVNANGPELYNYNSDRKVQGG